MVDIFGVVNFIVQTMTFSSFLLFIYFYEFFLNLYKELLVQSMVLRKISIFLF